MASEKFKKERIEELRKNMDLSDVDEIKNLDDFHLKHRPPEIIKFELDLDDIDLIIEALDDLKLKITDLDRLEHIIELKRDLANSALTMINNPENL